MLDTQEIPVPKSPEGLRANVYLIRTIPTRTQFAILIHAIPHTERLAVCVPKIRNLASVKLAGLETRRIHRDWCQISSVFHETGVEQPQRGHPLIKPFQVQRPHQRRQRATKALRLRISQPDCSARRQGRSNANCLPRCLGGDDTRHIMYETGIVRRKTGGDCR
jgi:hypothetical protein